MGRGALVDWGLAISSGCRSSLLCGIGLDPPPLNESPAVRKIEVRGQSLHKEPLTEAFWTGSKP